MRSYREPGITYLGLSTETKPTTDIVPGTKFHETDTGIEYLYAGDDGWVPDLRMIYALSQAM